MTMLDLSAKEILLRLMEQQVGILYVTGPFTLKPSNYRVLKIGRAELAGSEYVAAIVQLAARGLIMPIPNEGWRLTAAGADAARKLEEETAKS